MRILHTSDWHVGRTIRGRSRAEEHRAVLAEIAAHAERESVDMVLIAGDQFDTAAPAPESEQIVYRALLELARTGAEVVVICGNHDNARRWGAIKPLLDLTNVHAAASLRRPDDGGVIELTSRGGERALVALVPFLSQRAIVTADQLMTGDASEHVSAYAERCRRILAALAERFTTSTVNLVVAHLTVAGAQPVLGGGERMAHTIFDYFVTPQSFPTGAHYVALGHLHRPHRVPGPAPLWYCGSPLQLDFGEAERDHKAVLLVDVSPDTPAQVRELALASGRRLKTLRGTLPEVEAQRDAVDDAYLRVVLDEPPRSGLAGTVRELFPNAVEVVVVSPDADRGAGHQTWEGLAGLRRSPLELFSEYLAEQGIEDPAMQRLFRELLEAEHASDAA